MSALRSVDLRDTPPAAPFYAASGDEIELFEHAYRHRLPFLLKGPTGCGKTPFVSHMAARLGRSLYTVSCHDDLTAAALTGRYLLKGGDTVWMDGPLTRAVLEGAVCYLDEVVEARKDVTVVLHPLTDDRRILPLERTGEVLHAPPEFMLVVSYNPGYQNILKNLKPSTRQRFNSMAASSAIGMPRSRPIALTVRSTPRPAKSISAGCWRGAPFRTSGSSRALRASRRFRSRGIGTARRCASMIPPCRRGGFAGHGRKSCRRVG